MTQLTALRSMLANRDVRAIALSVFATTVGTGMITTGGLIFFVQGAGLATDDIVVGLTVAGVVGLLVSVFLGHLADRLGPRGVCAAMLVLRIAGISMFLVTRSLPTFIVAVVIIAIAEGGGIAAGGALIAAVSGTDRVRVRSLLHSVVNAGVAIGAAVAGVAIGVGTRSAFNVMIISTLVSLSVATLALLGVSSVPPTRRPPDRRRWESLRDRRYLAVTAAHAVLGLHFEVMTFAVPLWILQTGAAPAWLISVMMLVNTGMVILFQVPASAGAESITGAAALGRRAGVVLLVSCAILAYAGIASGWVAVTLFLLGACTVTIGELWQQASSFGLSHDLAPDHAQGQYQAVFFAVGRGAARTVAPAVLGLLCLAWGLPGWIVLGVILLGAGALLPLIVGGARATQPAGPAQAVPDVAHQVA